MYQCAVDIEERRHGSQKTRSLSKLARTLSFLEQSDKDLITLLTSTKTVTAFSPRNELTKMELVLKNALGLASVTGPASVALDNYFLVSFSSQIRAYACSGSDWQDGVGENWRKVRPKVKN